MDRLWKARSFISNLVYDLNTVRYLLDYGRIKETVSIIEKILSNIAAFREDGQEAFFPEKFWVDKLPPQTPFAAMCSLIRQYAHSDEELEKIGYRNFVKNISIWSWANIPRIKKEAKSPVRRKLEKWSLYAVFLVLSLSFLAYGAWQFATKTWGLYGEFFTGMNFEQKISTGISRTIDFDNPVEMNAQERPEHYSARWDGYLLTPKKGWYTFYLLIDDGGRLFVDGKTVIDQWSDHNSAEFQQTIFLKEGAHKIRIDYYNDTLAAVLKLYWMPAGGVKEIIPARYFRH